MTLLETRSKSGKVQHSLSYRRWRLAVDRARLFEPGDRVGVAVSGGPDSMLLLDFMVEYAREASLTLAVAHFNHHLRGAESDEDEDFVRARAQQLKVDFLCSGAQVAEVARQRKANVESVARELRYRFFRSLLTGCNLDRVATAHTANDQAETVLLRLLRGTGTRGLGGIYPVVVVPGGQVVRPFLSLTRAEVEAEAARRGLVFRTDATNLNNSLARNRIRQEVLPLLAREFNPNVVRTLSGFADRARSDEDFLDTLARQRATELLVRSGGTLRMNCRRLSETPLAIARRVLRLALEEARADGLAYRSFPDPTTCDRPQEDPPHPRSLFPQGERRASTRLSLLWPRRPKTNCLSPRPLGGEGAGVRGIVTNCAGQATGDAGPAVTHAEIESLTRLASDGQSGKRLLLAGGVGARREFEWLVIEKAVEQGVFSCGSPHSPGFCYRLHLPSEISVPELGLRLRFRLVDMHAAPAAKRAYTEGNGIWLDAGQLSAPLILRNWRPGDRVGSGGSARPVKLKELFQRRHVPIVQRPCWPVLEAGSEIVWARGFEAQFERLAPSRYRLLISEEQYGPDASGPEKK